MGDVTRENLQQTEGAVRKGLKGKETGKTALEAVCSKLE